jgi:hypothetical protein
MSVPFTTFPTLGELILAAKAQLQGCELKTLTGIVGPRGDTPARYLVALGRPIVILPNLRDDERLAPDQIAALVRVLRIEGFDKFFIDENRVTDYDYHPVKPS